MFTYIFLPIACYGEQRLLLQRCQSTGELCGHGVLYNIGIFDLYSYTAAFVIIELS